MPKHLKSNMKKYNTWLSKVKELAANESIDISRIELLGWFNAGHSPNDIIDNWDLISNPGHP